jgi:acyl-CoA thioesterase-2
MPNSTELMALLHLEELGGNCYSGGQPRESSLDKVYGGQLFGQALVAAQRTVDPGRSAHSVQAFCLEPGDHGSPVRYQVECLRDGRSFSARSVLATQEDRLLMRCTASFQPHEPGLAHAAAMPDVPPPAALPTIQDTIREFSELPDEPWRREWSGLDIRYVVTEQTGRRGPGPGIQQIWIRVQGRLPDDPVVHRQVLTYLSDITLLSASLIPHGLVVGAPDLPRATLSHTVWLHDDVRADEWLLVDQRSPWAGGARGLTFAEVFTADGVHVASYAQEGLVRPRGGLRERLGVT